MAGEKKGFFSRLVTGPGKTRKAVVYGLDNLLDRPGEIDDDFYDELEEVLITGDVGVRVAGEVLEKLRAMTEKRYVRARSTCRDLLIGNTKSKMDLGGNAYDFEKTPSMLLLVGVNGVSKTTTAGKMAARAKADGRRVLFADTNTLRAAATEQLEAWSQRAGAEIVKATAGADPAVVIFDACQTSRAQRTDPLIYDTTDRLHGKKNLMEELRKIDRVVQRELPGYRKETLLVLDGATGQNTVKQAKEFGDIYDILGIVLTKLDGSAKNGVATAIQAELKLPVKYIGVGGKVDDLGKFGAGQYVGTLLTRESGRKSEKEA